MWSAMQWYLKVKKGFKFVTQQKRKSREIKNNKNILCFQPAPSLELLACAGVYHQKQTITI